MKNTLVSLKEEFKSAAGKQQLVARSMTFQQTLDFAPHHENYLGEVPMLYSFSKEFAQANGLVEIKDGYFSLIPLLLKEHIAPDWILPEIATVFLDSFYYSIFSYQHGGTRNDMAYVLFDYYQELSSTQHLQERFVKLRELARCHQEIKVCFSIQALSSRKPNSGHELWQMIRTLPDNCEIISNTELFELKNFHGHSVHLLTDEDFVLTSPWENIFAARGAIINGQILPFQDEVIKRVAISTQTEKLILRKTHSGPLIAPDIFQHLKELCSMLKSHSDMLNPNYLRQLRENIKLIRKQSHAN